MLTFAFVFYTMFGQAVLAADATQTVSPFSPYFSVVQYGYPHRKNGG